MRADVVRVGRLVDFGALDDQKEAATVPTPRRALRQQLNRLERHRLERWRRRVVTVNLPREIAISEEAEQGR